MLGLEKQIHVYSLDTACFYNQQEMNIHQKLVRLYYLRNKIRNKKERNSLYTHQLNRIDKSAFFVVVDAFESKGGF